MSKNLARKLIGTSAVILSSGIIALNCFPPMPINQTENPNYKPPKKLPLVLIKIAYEPKITPTPNTLSIDRQEHRQKIESVFDFYTSKSLNTLPTSYSHHK